MSLKSKAHGGLSLSPCRFIVLTFLVTAMASFGGAKPLPLRLDVPVRGWNILSDSETGAREVIVAAPVYGINQLHHSQKLVNRLIDTAHAAGIQELLAWDDDLYSLDYYPEEFRTGPGSTIDLDNPVFRECMKVDYRANVDRAPKLGAIVLQLMESGGNIITQCA